jgi:type VI secretion system protein ImpK
MNDFERRIREALNLQGDNGSSSRSQSGGQHTFRQTAQLASTAVATGASLEGLRRSIHNRPNESEIMQSAALINTLPADNETASINTPSQRIPETLSTPPKLTRPGLTQSEWFNPLIKAAFPLLLQVEGLKQNFAYYDAACRAQWVREAQHFQQTLIQHGTPLETVNHLTYLIFSWIDETLSRGNVVVPVTLLVEFYQDAWGGEKCFEHLNHYWQDPISYREILQFYDLILSLGFYGKFAMVERGVLMLADLRHQLDLLLYLKKPTETLASVTSHPVKRHSRRLTPLRFFVVSLLLLIIGWGVTSWMLHNDARSLRSAIMAWTPPEPKRINIMSTLPQPLPAILQEGWLEVRKDPRGWLLIFTSDGAFATGKATLLPDFVHKRNIERLGEALSAWPGDLEVIGHTDSTPFKQNAAESNLRLSQDRADTVATRLRSVMDVDSKYQRHIEAIGKGDSDPLADNKTDDGRKRNRRVDILWKIGQRADDANLDAVEAVRAVGQHQ